MDEGSRRQLGAGPQWEYRELIIPLNVREGFTDRRIRGQVEGIIAQHLATERDQGWEPDERVDLSSLRQGNRIHFRFRWFQGPIYISATIRLKRPLGR